MKTRRLHMIMKAWLVAILASVLLACIGIASASNVLDQEFIRAVKTRDVALVKKLLDQGADVNTRDQEGTPALMLAAWLQNRDVVRLLLESGANPNAKDKRGRTAVQLADRAGHYEIVEILGGSRGDRDMTGYPNTPKGVVEAYVKTGFQGRLSGSNEVKEQMRYIWDYFCPGWDCVDVVSGYRVTRISESGYEAKIRVVYDQIGAICGQDVLAGEKTKMPVTYDVEKHEGFWRIRAPIEPPRISAKSAIELLEQSLTDEVELNKKITSFRRYLGSSKCRKGGNNE